MFTWDSNTQPIKAQMPPTTTCARRCAHKELNTILYKLEESWAGRVNYNQDPNPLQT